MNEHIHVKNWKISKYGKYFGDPSKYEHLFEHFVFCHSGPLFFYDPKNYFQCYFTCLFKKYQSICIGSGPLVYIRVEHIYSWVWVIMLEIRLFCRSKTTKYFDAEIACFGSMLELHKYKHSLAYKSLVNISVIHTKLAHFFLKKKFLCQKKKNRVLWCLITR